MRLLGVENESGEVSLGWRYLFRLQTLRSAFYDERNAKSFLQSAISAGFDGREMYEYILAVFASDESKSFSGVKPLYCPCFFHGASFLQLVCSATGNQQNRAVGIAIGVVRFRTMRGASMDCGFNSLIQSSTGGASAAPLQGRLLRCKHLVPSRRRGPSTR